MKTKKLKRTIEMLEISEKNATHLSAIKNVTDGGTMLVENDEDEGKNILCSQDVLQRVKLFYDDDDEE